MRANSDASFLCREGPEHNKHGKLGPKSSHGDGLVLELIGLELINSGADAASADGVIRSNHVISSLREGKGVEAQAWEYAGQSKDASLLKPFGCQVSLCTCACAYLYRC